jgi:hypothetical protein
MKLVINIKGMQAKMSAIAGDVPVRVCVTQVAERKLREALLGVPFVHEVHSGWNA